MEKNNLGWIYYNHAVITTCAPHEEPNLQPLKDGSVWNLRSSEGIKPLFARYTTDFDCDKETGFWYIVKDGPFVMEELSKKYQKQVLKSLERCEVRRIDALSEIDELYEVYAAAVDNYQNPDNRATKDMMLQGVKEDGLEYWAAYDRNTGKMAGWMSCSNNGDWTETISAKYHPERLPLRPSDAIHYTVLTHYLNDLGQRYISSGSRNLNHKTNVQEYKVRNWKFRHAYCKLHLVYRKDFKIIINMIYPFRSLFNKLDNITFFHQINSLLRMEEIVRNN